MDDSLWYPPFMRFYNRQRELEHLRQIQARAARHGEFTLLRGRRRLGKTELVREFLKEHPRGLYFFVSRKRSSDLLAEFAQLLREKNLLVGELRDWDAFFTALFHPRPVPPLLVFDEFQNFQYVEPAVFSI